MAIEPFDALHLLRAFDSAERWPAMSEEVFGRLEWSHGDSNPDIYLAKVVSCH
jgi:hypothetical protein